MANPLLRRYSVTGTGSAQTLVTVPANRALAISKIVCNNATGATVAVTVTVGGSAIVSGLSVAAAGVYTETGLVAQAGETVTATGAGVIFSVYGEEVDNV